MRRVTRTGIILCAAVFASLGAFGDEEKPSSIALESPDYSKEALMKILASENVQVDLFEDHLEVRWADWIFRFLPIVLPLTINDGSAGSAQINGPVSALALLGVDYPRAGPAGDELPPPNLTWRERVFRHRMIRLVNAANRRDNR